MRTDDRRRATGYRVLFDTKTELEAWYLAKMLRRLGPERVHQLRLLADSMALEDAMQPVEETRPRATGSR